jgi:hypothetical protein
VEKAEQLLAVSQTKIQLPKGAERFIAYQQIRFICRGRVITRCIRELMRNSRHTEVRSIFSVWWAKDVRREVRCAWENFVTQGRRCSNSMVNPILVFLPPALHIFS